MRTAIAISLGLALALSTTAARADKCEDEAAKKQSGRNWHWEKINGRNVQVIDTVIQVCGKVPRPNVIYVLQSKTINYEWENLKQDFLPLILATVKKAPF